MAAGLKAAGVKPTCGEAHPGAAVRRCSAVPGLMRHTPKVARRSSSASGASMSGRSRAPRASALQQPSSFPIWRAGRPSSLVVCHSAAVPSAGTVDANELPPMDNRLSPVHMVTGSLPWSQTAGLSSFPARSKALPPASDSLVCLNSIWNWEPWDVLNPSLFPLSVLRKLHTPRVLIIYSTLTERSRTATWP